MNRAVVYVRVSSADQVNGFSLDVQERVCRDYCERQGWAVGLVAREEGESAKTTDRRELQKVLARLRKPGHGFTQFVVYDVSRFTRETADYFALKSLLAAAGVQLVAVTQPFDDSPTGKFMGTILAAAGTFDNDVRREKVLAGMKEAIKHGIWPWVAPIGYLSHRGVDKRSTLIHDPVKAPLVRFVFERIASGLVTQEEARVELEERGVKLPRESFRRLVHNPIYCGRIVAPEWGLESKAAFEPIVAEGTWRKAQERLAGKTHGWRRSELRPDFPFRWWTRCAECGRALTASYSRGKRAKFPYYRCPNGCQNVAREVVHDSFLELLDSLACPPGLWKLWDARLRDAWQRRTEGARTQLDGVRRRLQALDAKDEKLVSALLEGDVDAATVKRMRAKLAAERAEVSAAVAPLPLADFEHALRAGRRLAESPRTTWDALDEGTRPGFLRIAFPARLEYSRETGFRTPIKSLYLSSLGSIPPTCGDEWWTRRGDVRTPDLSELITGWAALAPALEVCVHA